MIIGANWGNYSGKFSLKHHFKISIQVIQLLSQKLTTYCRILDQQQRVEYDRGSSNTNLDEKKCVCFFRQKQSPVKLSTQWKITERLIILEIGPNPPGAHISSIKLIIVQEILNQAILTPRENVHGKKCNHTEHAVQI